MLTRYNPKILQSRELIFGCGGKKGPLLATGAGLLQRKVYPLCPRTCLYRQELAARAGSQN